MRIKIGRAKGSDRMVIAQTCRVRLRTVLTEDKHIGLPLHLSDRDKGQLPLSQPACAGRFDRYGVAGRDGEDGLEVAGEVPVQRAPFERDLVERHEVSSRLTASTTRSTEGM